MSPQTCPYCGSSNTTRSPSGQHRFCRQCQRILLQERETKPRGRKQADRPARAEDPGSRHPSK